MSLDPDLSGALTAYLERRAADPTPDAASLRRSSAALAPAAGADLLKRIHRDELPRHRPATATGSH
ncbi:hypothetical protein G7085_12175 [Tessaracoccus sp. HDW20]|uniref:hypothetical protein n=1 Tax=Tessaracoccus coleopterorum TaxID=2714950 RepID=UPI0018D3DED9|nr:hypothetical protein [Tessaracoccus coleopterorum]NHB85120.1 hypothetical protein [Tessaracoccus coleopterorum]